MDRFLKIVSCCVLSVPFASGSMAAEVGSTPGDFSVTPTGAATYRIPIQVPPGVAGLAPEIKLEYSSQRGNGLLGVGWDIVGLSAITRCPQTRDTDGIVGSVTNEYSDRFCLDGQRLVLDPESATAGYGESDAEYRTEVESFQAVWSKGSAGDGPRNFVVKGKDGLIRAYGDTSNSRVEVEGSSTVATWAINKIEDRYGNKINFIYGEETAGGQIGEHWIKNIVYKNNAGVQVGKIVFERNTNRPDKRFGYAWDGRRQSLTRRITGVRVTGKNDADLVRTYTIAYEESPQTGLSHLESVTECDRNGLCLPPTTFVYDHGTLGFTTQAVLFDGTPPEAEFIDINGDGRPDVMYPEGNAWKYRINVADLGSGPEWLTGLQYSGYYYNPNNTHPIDYNGDGFGDLLIANKQTGEWDVLLTVRLDEVPFDEDEWDHVIVTTGVPHYDAFDDTLVVADLNGDGLQDLVFNRRFGSTEGFVAYYLNSATGFQGTGPGFAWPLRGEQRMTLANFDGDNRPDLYVSTEDCNLTPAWDGEQTGPIEYNCADTAGALTWNGSGFSLAHPDDEARLDEFIDLDVNGDGLTDLVHADTQQSGDWKLYLNRGGSLAHVWSGGNLANGEYAQAMDYNSDGLSDLLIPQGGVWQVMLGRSENAGQSGATASFDQAFSTGAPDDSYMHSFVADMNGDSLTDLAYFDNNTQDWFFRPQVGDRRGLMTSVTDGLGAKTTVNYFLLSEVKGLFWWFAGFSDWGLGNGGQGPTTPRERHYMGPMPLVQRILVDNGTEIAGDRGVIMTDYRYRGPKLNQWGRGFLGFDQVSRVNANALTETITTYRQDFPFTGMANLSTQRRRNEPIESFSENQTWEPNTGGSGIRVSEVEHTLASRAIGAAQFAYIDETKEEDFDPVTGDLFRVMTTDYTYEDNYGNPKHINITVDDGAGGDVHQINTVNYFDNDEAKWCLGLLNRTEVTHIRAVYPGSNNGADPSVTRTSTFTNDMQKCVLLTETIEPGDPLELTVTHGYDLFGNKDSETHSDGSESRTTETIYDTVGQHPVTIKNALDQTEVWVWTNYGNLGVPDSITDPNGLVTSFEYDGFGRKTLQTEPLTSIQDSYTPEWCNTSGCSHEYAVYKITESRTGRGQTVVEFDRLGRQVAVREAGFDGTWVNRDSYYDPAGREYATSLPYYDNEPVCWTWRGFDSLNRVVDLRQAAEYNGDIVTSDCDAPSHPTYNSPPDLTRVTTTAYNDLTVTVTDAAGRTVQNIYNVMDRLRQTCEGDCATSGIQNEYDYHPLGQRSLTVDALDNEIHVAYNLRGFRTLLDDFDLGPREFTFNAFGEVMTVKDAKNVTTTFEYDPLGRVETRTEPDSGGVTAWFYDTPDTNCVDAASVGQVTKVTQPDGTQVRYCHNAEGRLKRSVRTLDGSAYHVNWTYDVYGRLKDVVYPASKGSGPANWNNRFRVRYSYNDRGYATQISDYSGGIAGDTFWTASSMDALGNHTEQLFGNGVVETRDHDRARGNLNGVTAVGSGTIQNMTFRWDPVGNLVSRADNLRDLSETYGYDTQHRLSTINGVVEHEYTKIGNIKRKGGYENYRYTSPRKHAVRLVNTPLGERDIRYDANGNIKRIIGGDADQTLTWTSFNKPNQITDDGTGYSSQFWYDHNRLRWKQSATSDAGSEIRYYVDGLYEKVVAGGGTIVEHAHHIRVGSRTVAVFKRYDNEEEVSHWLHHDHLGSIVATSDDAGNLDEAFAYDAWGKRRNPDTWAETPPTQFLNANLTPRGFTEHEHLSHVGWIHMNGRIYSPELGRFASPDPLMQFPSSTQGQNRYSYALNNPLRWTDSSGNFVDGGGFSLKIDIGPFDVSIGANGVGIGLGGPVDIIRFMLAAQEGVIAWAESTKSFPGAIVPEFQTFGGQRRNLDGHRDRDEIRHQERLSSQMKPRVQVRMNGDSGSLAERYGGGLDYSICQVDRFSCTRLPDQNRLEKVASGTAIIGIDQSDARVMMGKYADVFSVLIPTGFSVRLEARLIESRVHLYRITRVGKTIVRFNGEIYGSFDEYSELTDRYVEIADGTPYTRSVGLNEALIVDLQKYPIEVEWIDEAGNPIPEQNIERRSW